MQASFVANRKAVMGLGNLLMGDEGFGIHAVEAMQSRYGEESGVEFIDGGVLGLSLLPEIEECSHLLVLDIIDAGRSPGEIIVLLGEQIPLFSAQKLSEHQVSFQEVLGLAQVRGTFPGHLALVGVQPASLELGTELSQPVASAMPAVIERAARILAGWGLVSFNHYTA